MREREKRLRDAIKEMKNEQGLGELRAKLAARPCAQPNRFSNRHNYRRPRPLVSPRADVQRGVHVELIQGRRPDTAQLRVIKGPVETESTQPRSDQTDRYRVRV